MRKQLNREVIASLDELLGILGRAHARRSSGQDDRASRQSSTLREKADKLRNIEDQATIDNWVSCTVIDTVWTLFERTSMNSLASHGRS